MGERRRLMRRAHGTHAGRVCDLGGGQHRGSEGNLRLLHAVAGAHACLTAIRAVLAMPGGRGIAIGRGPILMTRALRRLRDSDTMLRMGIRRNRRRRHIRRADHLRARHGRANPVEDQGGAEQHAQEDGRRLHVPQL
jgi:hypothetical protein